MESMKISRLKMERLKRGWTLEEVANMIGASVPALSTWEKQQKTPAVHMAIRLAKLYRVDITDIFSANRNN